MANGILSGDVLVVIVVVLRCSAIGNYGGTPLSVRRAKSSKMPDEKEDVGSVSSLETVLETPTALDRELQRCSSCRSRRDI